MKRTALTRRTPLRSNSTLARSPLDRRPGPKALREADALAAFRLALHLRSDGRCEARTPACPPGPHEGTDCHHRCPADRDAGRHDPDRGLLLCRAGHQHVHAHPAESYAAGWLLRSAS